MTWDVEISSGAIWHVSGRAVTSAPSKGDKDGRLGVSIERKASAIELLWPAFPWVHHDVDQLQFKGGTRVKAPWPRKGLFVSD